MPELTEKISGNQFLVMAIVSAAFIIASAVSNDTYLPHGFLTFVYFYLAFFTNTFFVKVIYKGNVKGRSRTVEFFVQFLLLSIWLGGLMTLIIEECCVIS